MIFARCTFSDMRISRVGFACGSMALVLTATACGSRRIVESTAARSDGTDLSVAADPPVTADPVVAVGSEGVDVEHPTGLDASGYRFQVTPSIEEPGQRLDPEVFMKQLDAAGFVFRDGMTFGPGPLERDPSRVPDFVASLDVNGSGTIVGFVKAGDDYFVPKDTPPETTIYGSDGRTVVGTLVATRTTSVDESGTTFDTISFAFVPKEST
jgi:hypothetical protein